MPTITITGTAFVQITSPYMIVQLVSTIPNAGMFRNFHFNLIFSLILALSPHLLLTVL
jgi:hypothetical protein